MFKKIVLKNGLRIISIPKKTALAATVLILVRTGSKYEKKDTNGISHFLEHMLFKGTKNHPSPLSVAETLDKVGGVFNAFTSEEYTGYYAKVESSHFELALDWVSDIFLNSTLPKKEMEKERGVIVQEINMLSDHPLSYVQILWPELLYGDQPAGWNIAGTKKNVMKMSQKELADYWRKQYVASNTVVCIAGGIKQKQSLELAKRYFTKMPTSSPIEKAKVFERQNNPQILVHFKETDQTHLCLGVRSYNSFHSDKYVIEILGTILGGMMSSRMFIEVREKLGLCYYIRTSVDDNPDTGFLVTQAGVDNENVEKAILTILKEYKKVSSKKISALELKKAKDNIKGKMALQLESSDALASYYGGQELMEKKILTPDEIFKKIDKVSANDILRVSKDIFRSRKLNLAVIGPFKEKDSFKKILKI